MLKITRATLESKEEFQAALGKEVETDKVKKAVDITMEMIEHPEHFCPVCHKRIGVCKHTKERRLKDGKD